MIRPRNICPVALAAKCPLTCCRHHRKHTPGADCRALPGHDRCKKCIPAPLERVVDRGYIEEAPK